MDIFAIDIGSYSVKFLKATVERGRVRLRKYREVVIAKSPGSLPADAPSYKRALEIVGHFLEETGRDEGKVIFQYPNHMVTSRYLAFPITSRKKISQMLPFQLDDNLPFPASEAHWVSSFRKTAQGSSVITSVAQKNHFQEFYGLLEDKGIIPSVLTSELAIVQGYLSCSKLPGHCAIVDLGHQCTKAYFVADGEVLSNHVSHVAGKMIDQAISQTYNIPLQEASQYKQQNCFFLTEQQYDSVSEEQREFASLMKGLFMPLATDLKRWELGHRVNTGNAVQTVYLVGGTSLINNLPNFLSQLLELKVEHLPFPDLAVEMDHQMEERYASSHLPILASVAQKAKNPIPNFLYGQYSGKLDQDLPLYSAGFILARVCIVSLVVALFLTLERAVFISPKIARQDKINKSLIKSPDLGLSARERRRYRSDPTRTLKTIRKKARQTQKHLSALNAATSINAIRPLARLGNLLGKNKDVTLSSFSSDGVQVEAKFKASTLEKALAFYKNLSDLGLADQKVTYKNDSTEIALNFRGDANE